MDVLISRSKIKICCFILMTVFFSDAQSSTLPSTAPNSGEKKPPVNCPFHPCTPERLGCQRLFRNELGCLLCRCENSTLNQDRPCQLHGCSVELLQCSGSRLKQTADGCTLCECEDEESARTIRLKLSNSQINSPTKDQLPIIASPDNEEDNDVTTSQQVATPPPVECEPLQCSAEELGCGVGGLVVNPLSGCRECDCAKELVNPILEPGKDDSQVIASSSQDEEEKECPDPKEILEFDGMSRGSNKLNKKKPMFKISLGKLRKGFEPGNKYKISLKANKKGKKFRAFLVTVFPAPYVTPKNNKQKKPLECENPNGGIVNDWTGKSKGARKKFVATEERPNNHARPIPQCLNQAIEAESTVNKTLASVEWIAPSCGCVYVSIAVVDETNMVGYIDDALLSNKNMTSRVNRALLKTVCAKQVAKLDRKKPRKIVRRPVKSNFISEVCYSAYKYQSQSKGSKPTRQKCANLASIYCHKYKFYGPIMKKCTKNYTQCCYISHKITKIQASPKSETKPKFRKPRRPKFRIRPKKRTRKSER